MSYDIYLKEKNAEKLFDIPLFYWEEWDEIDTGFLQFYNVEFLFESMKKYNGMDASLDMNGELAITDNNGDEVWKGFACAIPEFRREVNLKFEVK